MDLAYQIQGAGTVVGVRPPLAWMVLAGVVRKLAGLLNLGRCLDKRLPQVKVGLERLPRVLRVPLHAQAERLAFDFDALGNAVGCLGDQARALTQTIDATVMCRVGLDQPVPAKRALQQRARHDLDGMHGVVEHVGMAPLRAALASAQARHVHAQGAASGDIEQLRAAAGGKERLLGAKHLVNQLKLKAVANFAAQRGVVRTLVAPAFGVDVRAAGNGDTVSDFHVMTDDIDVFGNGHLQRQAAGGKDGIDKDARNLLVGGERLAQIGFRFFPAWCYQDERAVGGIDVDVRSVGR